jgi:hypothetical protein
MKKNVFVLIVFCCLSLMAQAQVAKFCMSYADFVDGKWTPVEKLTEGRTLQACQLRTGDNYVYFRTGDKEADKVLKRQAFAVMYGGQLYVNCRNLRCKDVPLDVSSYTQAVRYDDNKICVLAYKICSGPLLMSLGMDIAGIFVKDIVADIALTAGSTALWITGESLSGKVCYLLDGGANAKGKTEVTRMNDEFISNLLADDNALLAKYNAVSAKRNRQSAANVLPILMEKGLVAMNTSK